MDKDTVLKMLNPACLKKADEWESPFIISTMVGNLFLCGNRNLLHCV